MSYILVTRSKLLSWLVLSNAKKQKMFFEKYVFTLLNFRLKQKFLWNFNLIYYFKIENYVKRKKGTATNESNLNMDRLKRSINKIKNST